MTQLAARTTEQPVVWTTKNKIGLSLAIFYAITNIPTVFIPRGGGEGPPFAIGLISTLLALVAAPAAVVAWRRGSRAAARLTAASLIVITLTALPAFFVDVPAGVKVIAASGILLQVVTVLLMFSPPQR